MLAGLKEKVFQAIEPTVFRLFHKRMYHQHQFMNTRWMGVPIQKIPTDCWTLQEIIFETRPDIILETGTYNGGSALMMAHFCDLIGHGEIISIDIDPQPALPIHDRIHFHKGSSVDPIILDKIRSQIADKKVMVILDSDHRAKHVSQELKIYPAFVTTGCYLIIEDTNINGHPVSREFGPGPMEAMEEWAKTQKDFSLDESREKFLITFHPKGYWKKK